MKFFSPSAGRRLAVAATGILALSALSACGSDSGGDSGDGLQVGFSAAVLDNPFTVHLVDTVEAGGKDAGFAMLPTANADGDTAKQITDIQTLVTQGAKGIFVIPRDSDAIVPGVEAANNANVPVITVDTAANGGDIYMNIRADNVAMGKSVCEQMGKSLGGKGTILEIQGDLGTSSGADRNQGFSECMSEKYPDIKIIARPTGWESAKAGDVAQAVLSTNDIDGVFLASDSVMLEAVSAVMKNLGQWVPAGDDKHKVVVGIDGSGPALDAIRDGYLDATISQPINDYAKFGVEYMQDAVDGVEYKAGPTDHNSEIVEYKGNLADMLPSPVVTRENVDDKSLWGNAEGGK